MATQFRSKGKGKERKVYPINKKKAYGVERTIAYEEVESLRNQGKRARLIKTNRRLDLYAAFVAMTPADVPSAHTVKPPATVNVVEKPSRSNKASTVTNGSAVNLDYLLGIESTSGKLNLNKKEIEMYLNDPGHSGAVIRDHIMHFVSVDPSTISMISETIPTDLPDGFVVMEKHGNTPGYYFYQSVPDNQKPRKLPQLQYDLPDVWTVRLEGDSLKRFITSVKTVEKSSVALKLSLNGDKDSASVDLGYTSKDADYNTQIINVDKMAATTRAPPQERRSESVSLPTEYVLSTLRTMLGNKEFKNPDMSVVELSIREDYPIRMRTRRLGPNDEHIEVEGLVAPRME